MTEEALEARVGAIERALTDGHELADLPDGAALAARVEALEERADAVESRLDELEAASLAVRGYVGNIRAVNRDVERRVDAALAAVERLTDDGPLRAPNGEPVTGASDGRLRTDASDGRSRTGASDGRPRPDADHSGTPHAGPSPRPDGDDPTGASCESPDSDERDSPVPERILARVRGSL